MSDEDPLKKISQAIVDFSNAQELVEFEKYVLKKLQGKREIELFNNIWAATINFDNWNNSNLQAGFDKTIEILKSNYNLDDKICRFLANRAAFEWK